MGNMSSSTILPCNTSANNYLSNGTNDRMTNKIFVFDDKCNRIDSNVVGQTYKYSNTNSSNHSNGNSNNNNFNSFITKMSNFVNWKKEEKIHLHGERNLKENSEDSQFEQKNQSQK